MRAVLSACSRRGRVAAVAWPTPTFHRATCAAPARPSSKCWSRTWPPSVDGEVRFDAGTRGAYSTDGSNFRQVPIGVVLPRTVEAGAAAVAVCRAHGVPLLSRGGGTSLAGQCTNTAVVIDWSKYCNRVP